MYCDKFMIYLLLLLFSINAFAQVQLEGNQTGCDVYALSPDGETLAGCNPEGVIYLWDAATGISKDMFISEFLRDYASPFLTFSPDGTLLAIGSIEGRVTLWDVNTGTVKFVLEAGIQTISSISFNPDGSMLAICAAGRWGTNTLFASLWDVEIGKKITDIEIENVATCSTFSPDGTTLAIGTMGGQVHLWDVHKNLEIDPHLYRDPENKDTTFLTFSPDGTTLAIGRAPIPLYEDGNFIGRTLGGLSLYNFATKDISEFDYSSGFFSQPFAFSPDGKILAGYDYDTVYTKSLYFWDVSNGERKEVSISKRDVSSTYFVGFGPNGIFYAVETEQKLKDGRRWVDDTYFLWTISPENVFNVAKMSGEPDVPAWDVNQDGQINILDLVLVAQYLGKTDFTDPRADVNSDGTVNILDLTLVAKHLGT